jgi:hypothetical protein
MVAAVALVGFVVPTVLAAGLECAAWDCSVGAAPCTAHGTNRVVQSQLVNAGDSACSRWPFLALLRYCLRFRSQTRRSQKHMYCCLPKGTMVACVRPGMRTTRTCAQIAPQLKRMEPSSRASDVEAARPYETESTQRIGTEICT